MKKTTDTRWSAIIKIAVDKGYNPFPGLKFSNVLEGSGEWFAVPSYPERTYKMRFLSIEKIIFCHDFAKALWGEKKFQPSCTCEAIPGQYHSKLCATRICPHCNFDRDLANPSGYCNHVHYPECCRVCELKEMSWKDHLQNLVLAGDYLKYIESTLKEET